MLDAPPRTHPIEVHTGTQARAGGAGLTELKAMSPVLCLYLYISWRGPLTKSEQGGAASMPGAIWGLPTEIPDGAPTGDVFALRRNALRA